MRIFTLSLIVEFVLHLRDLKIGCDKLAGFLSRFPVRARRSYEALRGNIIVTTRVHRTWTGIFLHHGGNYSAAVFTAKVRLRIHAVDHAGLSINPPMPPNSIFNQKYTLKHFSKTLV
jgi:hypothetical protein